MRYECNECYKLFKEEKIIRISESDCTYNSLVCENCYKKLREGELKRRY